MEFIIPCVMFQRICEVVLIYSRLVSPIIWSRGSISITNKFDLSDGVPRFSIRHYHPWSWSSDEDQRRTAGQGHLASGGLHHRYTEAVLVPKITHQGASSLGAARRSSLLRWKERRLLGPHFLGNPLVFWLIFCLFLGQPIS